MSIQLRKANALDADFAFQVIKEAMEEYAIQTWGSWHEKESKEDAIVESESGNLEIIIYREHDIGTLQTAVNVGSIQIEKLYILSKYQNKGIGTEIISDFIELARIENKHLKLDVLKVNPAKHLYARLGFHIVEENSERISLQYTP